MKGERSSGEELFLVETKVPHRPCHRRVTKLIAPASVENMNDARCMNRGENIVCGKWYIDGSCRSRLGAGREVAARKVFVILRGVSLPLFFYIWIN